MWQWLFGVAVGLVLAAFGPTVFSLQRRRLRREQLLARYAELLAAASAELDRLREHAAEVEATGSTYTLAESEAAAEAEPDREANRRRLRQRAFAVRLLERDRALAEQVKVLVAWEPPDRPTADPESAPASASAPASTSTSASDPAPSAQALRQRAATLERLIDDLCERVRQTHGEALWEGGWRAGWNGLMRMFRGEPTPPEITTTQTPQTGDPLHPEQARL